MNVQVEAQDKIYQGLLDELAHQGCQLLRDHIYNILHATLNESHEDHDEVVNAIVRESMEAYEVKPVTITKSSIYY